MSERDETGSEETEFIFGDRFDLGLGDEATPDDRWDELTDRITRFADQSALHDSLGGELLGVLFKAENYHMRNSGEFLPVEARNALAYALFSPVERTLESNGEEGGSPIGSLPADELEELKSAAADESDTSSPGYY